MSRTQIVAIALTFILSALDGYDVLSVAFAAPAVTADWGVGRAALGIVLSAGLAGMALGAFLLAPLADLVGRRPLLLVSLGLMAVGMGLCAVAATPVELAVWRVVTGLGIGSCVAVINPVAAEFANARRRPLTVAIMAIGYPVGGLLGGLLAAFLLEIRGWPAIFAAGAVGALLLVPVVALLMPESLSFLLARQRSDTLPRLNAVLIRCGQPPVTAVPAAEVRRRRSYAALFAPAQVATTFWITIANALFAACAYFVLSWMPQMVADAGFGASTGSLVSATASSAGIAGGIVLGWLAQTGNLRRLATGVMIGLGVATIGFAFAPDELWLLLIAGALCGVFLFGGATGLYITIATTFRDQERASGSGFVSGAGRVTSAIAPLLAGWCFANGLDRGTIGAVFGGCAITAGVILFTGWTRHRST